MSILIDGIYPPIATPFKDGKVDLEGMRFNVGRWNRTKLHGFFVSGSNGEFVFLSDEEKLDIIQAVKEVADKKKIILAGTAKESTKATIEFTCCAAEKGAEVAVILPPHYYKSSMTPQVLQDFYSTVADNVPIPVLIYNMPAFTGVNISAEVLVKLSSHRNILGVKDSSGNIVQISTVIHLADKKFSVFAGSGSYLFPTIAVGGRGAFAAVANVAPEITVEIFEAAKAGDYDKARRLQLDILELNEAVTAGYGIPGLKTAMDFRGLRGGLPRLPLHPLGEDARCNIKNIMERLQLDPY